MPRIYYHITGMVIALALLTSCRDGGKEHQTAPPEISTTVINASNALHEAVLLSGKGPRHSGSSGSIIASDHILKRLKAYGVNSVINEFDDETPSGVIRFRNVVGTVTGRSDRCIVLVSHYDTKSGISDSFTGANDSGSSTGLLLEMARAFRNIPDLHPTVIFAFVDGEESQESYSSNDGLHGSRHLAQQLKVSGKYAKVDAVIVVDMIGDRDFNLTVPRNCSPDLVALLFEAAKAEGIRNKVELMQGMVYDDHVPFLARDIKALNILDFNYTGGVGRNCWHNDLDTVDKLSADSLAAAGRLVIRVINSIYRPPAAPAHQ